LGVRLTIVGCAGTLPAASSPASCYLLESGGFRVVVDFGSGAVGALANHADLLAIDAVLVSHLHADHCLDLVPYSYARRYDPRAPLAPVPVYGPAGLQDRICGAFEQRPSDALTDVYEFRELRPGRRTIGPFTVDLAPTKHPIETYAMRFMADGATIAYSADTAACDALVDIARNADLFLCEASYLDGTSHPKDMHLTAREAGEQAKRADARRLVLTHLLPWIDADRSLAEAAAAYGGAVEVARSGSTYELSVVSEFP
jgi:ribonuclease BN (tRNA processing enzyme)